MLLYRKIFDKYCATIAGCLEWLVADVMHDAENVSLKCILCGIHFSLNLRNTKEL